MALKKKRFIFHKLAYQKWFCFEYSTLVHRYLLHLLSSPFVLSDYTCAGNFSSSLHMAYVIFAHSHLYFKSLHLVTHFCLAHSAVRILVSTSYKAPGSLSAQKKKANKEKENKWDCYISWTLKHFRSSGCLPHCAGAAGSQEARVFIVVWTSGWGSAGESQVTVHECWMCWIL